MNPTLVQLGPLQVHWYGLLIVGPGQAKHALRCQIEHHKGLRGKVLALQTASRMTENELVAHAEAFYGLEMEKELT